MLSSISLVKLNFHAAVKIRRFSQVGAAAKTSYLPLALLQVISSTFYQSSLGQLDWERRLDSGKQNLLEQDQEPREGERNWCMPSYASSGQRPTDYVYSSIGFKEELR